MSRLIMSECQQQQTTEPVPPYLDPVQELLRLVFPIRFLVGPTLAFDVLWAL